MNQIATQQKSIKDLLNSQAHRFEQMLGKNASSFTTSVLQIVNSNELLKNADPNTILSCAFVSASLNLPLNNSLGLAYIVPYNRSYKDNNGIWQKVQEAQFQIGYKGYIQLAIRSGLFKRINACAVYSNDTDNDVYQRLVSRLPIKPNGEIVGYTAEFELLSGFTATLPMSIDEINAHAQKYSQTYRTYLDKKNNGQRANSVWADNFEAMAQKTVIKLLLSKQAPLSIEMQTAIQADQAVIRDVNGEQVFDYMDNQPQNVVAPMQISNEQMPQILALTQTMPKDELFSRYDLTSEQTQQVMQAYGAVA